MRRDAYHLYSRVVLDRLRVWIRFTIRSVVSGVIMGMDITECMDMRNSSF